MSTREWGFAVVPGTPRWVVGTAWAILLCVLPSGAWWVAVGFGVPLGWSDEHLRLERIPGYGTSSYVLELGRSRSGRPRSPSC